MARPPVAAPTPPLQSPATRCSLLVVDDEPAVLALLVAQLGGEFDVATASGVTQARQVFTHRPADVVLTDLNLRDGSGLQLLDWVRQASPTSARVLLSGSARVEDAVEAVNGSRVHRLLLKPWRADELTAALRAVARTQLLERNNVQLLDELRASHEELEGRVRQRTAELEDALRQLKVKNQVLERMALTDPLTRLPNRRAIELIARKELLRRARTPAALTVGLIDADHFRAVNSAHLHCGGDHVLTWLGQTLQASLRATDAIGRVGGEEFLVVAPATDRAGAEAFGERLRAAVAVAPTAYRGASILVTVSVGLAVCPEGSATSYDALHARAAAALSEAKSAGRNRCVVHSA
jgi:diguanylate cyclase (GGDEF)-like protein